MIKKILILACVVLGGCATLSPESFVHYDVVNTAADHYGAQKISQKGNILAGESFFDSNKVSLNLEIARIAGKIWYNLLVHWYSGATAPSRATGIGFKGHHLNIQGGSSLCVIADGTKMFFAVHGRPVRAWAAPPALYDAVEDAVYPATIEQIRKIVYAKTVSVFVLGKNYGLFKSGPKNTTVKRTFDQDNSANFKKFYLEEIMGQKQTNNWRRHYQRLKAKQNPYLTKYNQALSLNLMRGKEELLKNFALHYG